jgi:outer membrane receptor protein involved in Fe transport
MADTRKRRASRPVVLALVVPLTLFCGGSALAQELPTLEEAPPSGAKPKPGAPAPEVPEAIDVADMVLAAAKAPISVQESPSIISVITREQILSRGFRTLWDVLATVPGFESYRYQYVNRYAGVAVRGNAGVVLVLYNGVSIIDPHDTAMSMDRRFPLDNVERIEVTSGPGGVLWGANAYLGIVNIVTRDAQTFRGIEGYAGAGSGDGEMNTIKASLTVAERFFNNKLRFFLNANVWSSDGPRYNTQYDMLMPVGNAPQPDGAWIFRPSVTPVTTPRDYMAAFSGSLGYGPLQFDYYIPYEHMYNSFNDLQTRGDDPRMWNSTNGTLSPFPCMAGDTTNCLRNAASTVATSSFRVLALRYQDLLLDQKLALTVRGYFTSFDNLSVRQPAVPVGIFKSPVLLDDFYGGNPHSPDGWMSVYRYGGTVDATMTLPHRNRLIVGGELFNEGSDVRYIGQYTGDNALSLEQQLAPPGGFTLIANPAQRLVGAVFAHDEWRPWEKLALSGGLRYQYQHVDVDYTRPTAINNDGTTHYYPDGTGGPDLSAGAHRIATQSVLLGSAAGSYQIFKKTHVKVNFAQGFRPPNVAFLASPVNPGVTAYPGDPNLDVERSQAVEGEINTVLLERYKNIRKLYLRADYSYTTLSGLIVEPTFVPVNAGNRTANSVEFAAYLEGMKGWNFWLNYYFLDLVDADTGPVRNVARQHLNLGGSLKLLRNRLELNTVVTIIGPMQDLNRAFYTDAAHQDVASSGMGGYVAPAGQLRLDQMPAVALWRVGLWVRDIVPKVDLSAYVDNLLNVKYVMPDVEYNARQAPFPIPMPGISFLVSAWVKL